MIDIHHHIIYGIDDGPKTKDEMFAMLDRAAEEGVEKLYATPHYKLGIKPFDRNLYQARLQEARTYLKSNNIALEILEGAEVFYIPEISQQYLNEGLPTLGRSNFVLMEFQPAILYAEMLRIVDQICSFGYNLIFAHVERYRCLTLLPHRTDALKDRFPVYYQVNASSILNETNLLVRRFANWLLKEELVDFVASDAHNIRTRPCNLQRAFQKLSCSYGEAYATELLGVEGKGVFGAYDLE